jgi:hypothetical protein
VTGFECSRPDQQDAIGYVQGMNVLAAPFLYTLPSELEAFNCFARFIEFCCPLYVQPTLEGVHRGLKASASSPADWILTRSIAIGQMPGSSGSATFPTPSLQKLDS